MKAFILAGGKGLRLRPLTDRLPKAMVSIGGKSIIEWQIEWLKLMGISDFVIAVGHLGGKLVKHLGAGKGLGVGIEFSVEREALGTGGALMNAKVLLEDEKEFIACVGDIITNIDIRRMRRRRSIADISLTPLTSPYGVVRIRSGRVIGFEEKPRINGYWRNAGIYLIERGIFEHLPRRGGIESGVFPGLASKGLLSYTTFEDSYLHGIDSIKDVEEVAADIDKGVLSVKRGRQGR